MRQLERLAAYWLLGRLISDGLKLVSDGLAWLIALAFLAAAAVAAVRLWRDLAVLLRW